MLRRPSESTRWPVAIRRPVDRSYSITFSGGGVGRPTRLLFPTDRLREEFWAPYSDAITDFDASVRDGIHYYVLVEAEGMDGGATAVELYLGVDGWMLGRVMA